MTVGPLRRIVVVGNGIAGLTACDSARASGFEGELVVVGAEPEAAYSRPALSKALLKPEADRTAHELPPPTHGGTELRGVSATSLDVDARRIALSDGSELGYDGLVIATGARARRFTAIAAERTLRELGDAVALRSALAARPRVVIVGGGVLGMEIASGALQAGCSVTLVATAVPMSRQLGLFLGELLGTAAAAHGLTIVRARAAAVTDHGDAVRVIADGRDIPADVVVSAIGDEPNVHWLRGSGLLRSGTLVADSRGRVQPGIVAAGDVATWHGPRGLQRTPLWTTAIEQAKVAATTLVQGAGAEEPRFQPYFWTEQFGLALKAVGPLPLQGAPEVIDQPDEPPSGLFRWTAADGTRSAVALNYRIPIPRLRRLTAAPE